MSITSTAIALRCPHCGELHDSGVAHTCGEQSQPRIESLGDSGDELVGAVIGERYSILSRLTAGGMGVVYKAKHVLLDTEVAVKILLKPQDPDAQYRFLQEAQLASKIQHPNTVYISDFGVLPDSRSYIVMEFLRGPTLTQVIGRGPMAPLRVCQIGIQIARGLQAVHDKGIIHRDLKPDNIFLIEQNGQQDFVKIVDFGIATNTNGPTINIKMAGPDPSASAVQRALKERHTLPGTVLGTPHYMSPEQALGDEVDHRADQYALGCILYEMLSGVVPFDDDDAAALMFRHAYKPPPELCRQFPQLELPASVAAVVMRTLAKKREQRFESMRELEQVLTAECEKLSGRNGQSNPPLPAEAKVEAPAVATATLPTARSRRLLLLGVLGLALLTGLFGGLLGYRHSLPNGGQQEQAPDTKRLLELRAAALEQLKQDLRSPDAELRQNAATALGATYDPELTARLVALLDDKEVIVQVRAAEVLGQLGQPGVLPRLSALLTTSADQPVVVEAAAEALDQLGDARGQKALHQALTGKQDAARLRAALYLTGRGDLEAKKVLSTVVQRGKVPEDGAIQILSRLAQAGDPSARDNLLTRLGTAQNRDSQLTLASSLGRIGESRGRDFLRDQSKRPGPQQLRAAAALAALDEAVEPQLFRSVLDNPATAPQLRLTAVQGLSYVGATADLHRLEPLLKDGREPRLRQGAAIAMIKISDADPVLAASQSLGWAQQAASDPNWLLRDQAVAALGDLEGRDSAAALAQLLRRQDSDPLVRREAAKALGRRRDSDSLRALHDGLSDKDAGVREDVLRSLSLVAQRLLDRGQRTVRDEVSGWLRQVESSATGGEQVAARASLLFLGDESQRPPLLRTLESGDEATRQKVLEQVDRDREILAAGLNDKSPPLRRLAARKLAALGDKRAIPGLRELAADPTAAAEGLLAYAALRRLGDAAPPPPNASDQLGSSDPTLRSAALEAAVAQNLDSARPALERAARDPDRRVRLKVIELLDSLASSGSPPTLSSTILRRLARDVDVAVRARASALLSRLLAPSDSAKEATKSSAADGSKGPPEAAPPTTDSDPATATPRGRLAQTTAEGLSRDQLQTMLRAGSEPFKRKDFAKAQKALERLSSLCSREPAKVCAPVGFELSYYLGRAHEAQGQLAEAMTEFQRLEGQSGGSAAERSYRAAAVKRLSRSLGRVEIKQLHKGRCQTTVMWVTPGEQEIRISAQEKRTVKVAANQQTTVGACK